MPATALDTVMELQPVGMNASLGSGRPEPSQRGRAAETPIRVLLADDDGAVLNVARRVLQRAGFTVTIALDGTDALAKVRAQNGDFDVVLSDILMPDMDGIELAVRARSEFHDLPFVFMTGFSDIAKDRERARGICEAILGKPFDIHELVETLQEVAK